MPLGERFPTLYDNNDGRFYDKIRPDCRPMTTDMSGLKIYTKRVHLEGSGIHSNLEED